MDLIGRHAEWRSWKIKTCKNTQRLQGCYMQRQLAGLHNISAYKRIVGSEPIFVHLKTGMPHRKEVCLWVIIRVRCTGLKFLT